VGAICINIDAHFIRDAAYGEQERLTGFIDNFLRTEFQLDENILSKDEFRLAMRGKRHFMDDALRGPSTPRQERRLAAILFSDIVGFTALMGSNEALTLSIVESNEEIHLKALSVKGGRLLKRLGDGLLASFDSASGAVECAQQIREDVERDGRFQVRIGIHVGEVIEADGDVHGDGVNVASRIQSEVQPGDIAFSAVVYENIKNKPGLSATSIGEHRLRNVADPMILYTLDPVS
jgi:class 3 adenylate cyclase